VLRNVLTVGRGRMLIGGLERADPPPRVYVLEEPELAQHQVAEAFRSPIVQETRVARYQESDDLVQAALEWHAQVGFDAIVPAFEFAVPGANRVAEALGLRALGATATAHLTNKLRLRGLCQQAGIRQPRFDVVRSAADARAFFDGAPIVLKPATLQGSAGVVKIERPSDIEPAFAEVLRARDQMLVSRLAPAEYLAEEYVPGGEISVETFVQGGRAIFHNITGKRTTHGRYFVEIGHVVPATLESWPAEAILGDQERLIAALNARDGFLHAEWKLGPNGPTLLECAGRLAGDYILDLIEAAYEFNPYLALVQVAAGEPLALPRAPRRAASIRFFEPCPGHLRRIDGLERLAAGDPRLLRWQLKVSPGDTIAPLTSSAARVGFVMASGPDSRAAEAHAEALVGSVAFETEPVAAEAVTG
jgi:biotin carboxylase